MLDMHFADVSNNTAVPDVQQLCGDAAETSLPDLDITAETQKKYQTTWSRNGCTSEIIFILCSEQMT